MTEPRRHHFIPNFYLRRFAHKKQVRVYERLTGRIRQTNTNNACVQTGFYDLEGLGIQERDAAENAFASLESEARTLFDDVIRLIPPLGSQSRLAFALFMATLKVRTPEYFDTHDVISELLRETLRRDGLSDVQAAEVLHRSRAEDPSRTERVLMMFRLAERLAPILHDKCWVLGCSRSGGIITSDHPLPMYKEVVDPHKGFGIIDADEIHFPLDPWNVLILAPQQIGLCDGTRIPLRPENVEFTNSLIASYCYEYLFQYPNDDQLPKYLIPHGPRPLLGSTVVGEPDRISPRHRAKISEMG